MFKTIDQPADCEIRSVIRFLTARNVSPAEIHRQISEVYGPNAMSDSKVRKWVRAFKDGWENVHDEPVSYTHLDVYKRQVIRHLFHIAKALYKVLCIIYV